MNLFDRYIDNTQAHWTFRYGLATILVAIAAAARFYVAAYFGATPPFITFYPCIMLTALSVGARAGVFATLLSASCADYFFFEPYGAFATTQSGDFVSLLLFVAMGLVMSAVAGELHAARRRVQAACERELAESEDRFNTVVAGIADYAIYVLDPEGRVATWNAGAQRIKGWAAAEVLGRNFAMFFTQEAVDLGTPKQHLERAAAAGSFAENAERIRKDGTRFWAEIVVTALRNRGEGGQLRGFVKIVHDVSRQRQAVLAMAESRAQLARILESAMDAILTIDADQRIAFFNAAAVKMFKCPVDEALGQKLERFIPQRFHAAHSAHIRNFATTGTTSRGMGSLGTLYGVRASGEEFPIEASISQVEIGGQKVFTVILRDITERKRTEEHQALLLRELAHRVKNTLAVVHSVAAQTRRFASPEQFDVTFAARLRALGNAHDLLTQSEWEGATLMDVVQFSFAPYEPLAHAERWRITGPDVWLSPNEAVTLSLAFHELATNAAKFGALSNDTGTIDIGWGVMDDDRPEAIEIRWIEDGGPRVTAPARKGFGSTLLERAVAHELAGTTELRFLPEGLDCALRFPLSPRVKLRT